MGIGAMIVTYNRLDKLKTTLDCFESQTIAPEYLLVVDNASTDGTKDYLDNWLLQKGRFVRRILRNKENLGGSGGFYTGLQECLNYDSDWIWVSDDDAFPEKNAIANALNDLKSVEDRKVAAICGEVINEGKIDIDHRRVVKRGFLSLQHLPVGEDKYKSNSFRVDEFSYVGSIMKKEALKEKGITDSGYFICYDDTEHSLRLKEYGEILCFPNIKLHHDVGNRPDVFGWKAYYATRNKLDLYKKHFEKRFYYALLMKLKVKNLGRRLLRNSKKKTLLYDEAIRDGINGNLGKHPVYLPAWKL